jgi:hypothetical protein
VATAAVHLLQADDQDVRAYTLRRAAELLDRSERTLLRQVQNQQLPRIRTWSPQSDLNPTKLWLLDADAVDALVTVNAELPGADGSVAPSIAQQRAELARREAALREREELIQLEEAVRVRDQVAELQHENETLRAELAREQSERSTLAAQLQQALALAADMAGQRVVTAPA